MLPITLERPALHRAVLLAAALIVAVGVFVSTFAGSASAATLKRHMAAQPGSWLTIHDDEPWPFADEQEYFNLGNEFLGAPEPSRPLVDTGGSHCAGDEVRIEYQQRVQLSLTSPGWVFVTLTAQMYEGASCSTRDLDGQATTSFWIAPGQTLTRSLSVHNTDEGGDWATLSYVLKNGDWLLS